ncbi:MAG: hypothetical protein KGM42_17105 [Hyphomicrobiales bacterium]|nr:hypothetical protein [Hyphomicrobiales bacterium]
MSEHPIVRAIENAELDDPTIELIDYHAYARRLLLRIASAAAGGRHVRTLIFDGVVALHCEPQSALDPLAAGESAALLRFEGRERKTGEADVLIVMSRAGHPAATASFRATGARWIG